MLKAMALWEESVIARPVALEIQEANCGTLPLPEFPLRLISSFADCETRRRKFKIKKPDDIFGIKRIFQTPC
jgi:hypothetical protein